jgi:hypothetical protein
MSNVIQGAFSRHIFKDIELCQRLDRIFYCAPKEVKSPRGHF